MIIIRHCYFFLNLGKYYALKLYHNYYSICCNILLLSCNLNSKSFLPKILQYISYYYKLLIAGNGLSN